MLVRPISVQSRSLRHRQSGNMLVSKLMKMTRPNQRASFVLKRSLLLEETLQTFNGISVTIIPRRHKRSRNKSPNVDNQKLRKGSHKFPKHSPECKDMNGEESNGRNSPTLLPTAWQRI